VLYVCLPIRKLASRFTCAAFDSDDLATLDGFEVSEASVHERDEVFQEDGFTTENNGRNLPISEVLLVFKSAIHSQENEEDAHSCLGRQQLLSFFQCGDGHLA
jgi:hypothetical protein